MINLLLWKLAKALKKAKWHETLAKNTYFIIPNKETYIRQFRGLWALLKATEGPRNKKEVKIAPSV